MKSINKPPIKVLQILSLFMSAFLSLFANAVIVDLGNTTRDMETGLDWLDLTSTNDRTYSYVASQLGVGGEFAGWRFATALEVSGLFAHFGLTTAGIDSSDVVGMAAYNNALNLIGDIATPLYRTLGWSAMWGYTGVIYDINDPDGVVRTGVSVMGVANLIGSSGIGGLDVSCLGLNSCGVRNDGNTFYGSWLVMTAVPVPATAWLFGSGLLGLTGFLRRSGGMMGWAATTRGSLPHSKVRLLRGRQYLRRKALWRCH